MQESGWMLLLHRLPTARASERTTVWRKLKKIGALPLEAGGHLLPDRPELRERLGWLAEQVRQAGGEAVLVNTDHIEGLPRERLIVLFQKARAADYGELIGELRDLRAKATAASGSGTGFDPSVTEELVAALARCRARLGEIEAIDYFSSPAAATARVLLEETEALCRPQADPSDMPARLDPAGYRGRTWLTRPRPEVDRAGSAWLIRRFIDPEAAFVFGTEPAQHPEALPYDMAGAGFSHHGEDCSFETLTKRFNLTGDKALVRLGEIVHDADLEDGKFGRDEGLGVDLALKGWARLGLSDEELLKRGDQCFEALYMVLGQA